MSSSVQKPLPSHVGIIMDGNGRWAQQRKKPRTFGHKEGLNTAKRIVKHASELKVNFITLYTFSTENWKRATDEVGFLMDLIKIHLKQEMQFYMDNHIRVVHTGDIEGLNASIVKEIFDVTDKTKDFDGITVNLAINYGGRNEIVRSVKKMIENNDTLEITESKITKYLDHPDFPDPDLIIRTGGDNRISNFLLWQSAYSEIYVCNKYWPDWTEKDFDKALNSYCNRDRKFGGIL